MLNYYTVKSFNMKCVSKIHVLDTSPSASSNIWGSEMLGGGVSLEEVVTGSRSL